MNVLLVEDELAARRNLKVLINKFLPTATIVGEIGTIADGLKWFKEHQSPDVIFMDIELTDGKSFKLLENITVASYIIFVTAYDQYAIDAFSFNSINYLLKPVDESKFEDAIKKLRQQLDRNTVVPTMELVEQLKALQQQTNYKNRFLVKRGNKFVSVEATDVAYFCVRNELTMLITHDNEAFVTNTTLEQLENQADPSRFFRLNRQYLANITAISHLESYFKSKIVVHLQPKGADDVIVSQEKASHFKSWMDG